MQLRRSRKDIYFFKEHTHHYITAYRMYLDHKIFGVGIKNFENFVSMKNTVRGIVMCFSSS